MVVFLAALIHCLAVDVQVHLQGLTALRYISAAYFAFEALMVNELSGGVIDCSGGIDSRLVNTLTEGFSTMPGLYKKTISHSKQPQARWGVVMQCTASKILSQQYNSGHMVLVNRPAGLFLPMVPQQQ